MLGGGYIYSDEGTHAGVCRGSRLAINRINRVGRQYHQLLENAREKRDQLKSARESKEVKGYKKILLSLDVELARAKRELQMTVNRANHVNLNIKDLIKPTSLAGWFDCNSEQKKLKRVVDYVSDLAVQKGQVEGQIAFYKMLTVEGLKEIKRLIAENKKEIAITRNTSQMIKDRLTKYYQKLDKDKIVSKGNAENDAKSQINVASLKSKDNTMLMGSLVFFGILMFVKKVNQN